MRPRTLTWGAVLGLLVALLTPMEALAQADTTTTHFSATQSSASVNPCTGVPGTLTETLKGLTHVTTLPDGDHHATTTVTQTVTFVPSDPSQSTYTGKSTFFAGDNFSAKTFTLTITSHFIARGSDGSRIAAHTVGHATINANGTVTVELLTDRLSCP